MFCIPLFSYSEADIKITLPKGFRIGHAQDEHTGVTAIICEKGCVAGVDVRGGAPGTRETDLLKSEKAAQQIHAVVLTGGSAFGLAVINAVKDSVDYEFEYDDEEFADDAE